MRGRMVLALTVALVEQAQRPWVVDGQVVGTIGPRLRITMPDEPPAVRDASILTAPVTVPEVSIPLEDRRPLGRG